MTTFDVSVHVRLIDALTAPAKQVQRSMQQLAQTMNGVASSAAKAGAGMVGAFQGAFKKIGANFANFGAELRGHWGNLQNNVFASSLGAFGFEHMFEHQLKFEEHLQNIRALRYDREGKLTDALREKVLKLAMLYPVLGGKLGVIEGAEKLALMGLSLEDTTQGIDAIARASAAAHISASEAAESVMHVIQAYNSAFRTPAEKASAFEHVSDTVFAAMKAFGGTFPGIGAAMARGGPAGSQLGLTFDQAASLAGVLNMSGFSAETSGFALSSLFQRAGAFQTSKTGKAVKESLAPYGIDLGKYYHNREDFRKFGGVGVADYIKKTMGFDVSSLIPEFNRIANDPVLSANAENIRSAMSEAINKTLGLDPNDQRMQGTLQKNLGEMLRKTYANMDFLSFIKDLAESGAYRDTALMTKLSGVFQMPKLLDLIMKALTGDLDKRMDDFYELQAGATRVHLEIWNEGLLGALKKMAGLWDYFTDKLFDASGFNESLNKMAKSFLDWADGLKGLDTGKLWYLAAGLSALSVAAAGGLGIMAIGAGLATLLNPITLLVGGLAYLSYELYSNRAAISQWWSSLSPLATLAASGGGIVAGLYAICVAARAVTAAFMASPLGWAVRLAALGALVYENWDSVVGVFERLKKAISDLMPSMEGLKKPWKDAFGDEALDRLGKKLGDPWKKAFPGLFGDEAAPPDPRKHWYQRLGASSATIPEKAGADQPATIAKTENKTVNNSVSNNISVSVNVANSTQAPAAVGQAVGSAIGGRMRGAIHDMPQ